MAFVAIGVLLPVVTFEPAPVDVYLLMLCGVLGISGRVRFRRTYVLVAVGYICLGMIGWAVGEATTSVPTAFAARSIGIDLYFAVALVSLIAAFKYLPGSAYAVMSGYIVGAIAISCLILALHVMQIGAVDIYREDLGYRFRGTFKDPNVLGPYLVLPVVALGTGRAMLGRHRLSRMLAIPCVAVLWGTYSRGAYVALTVSVITYLGLRMSEQGPRARAAAICIASLGLAASAYVLEVAPPADLSDVAYGRLQAQTYDVDRFETLASAASSIIDHPLGLGPGTFGEIHGTNPHNLILGKAVDAGVFGALLLLGVVLAATRRALTTYLTTHNGAALIVAAVLTGHVAVSMFIYSHHWRHFMIICALAWGVFFDSRRRCDITGRHLCLSKRPGAP